jgi:hypothetical protein
MNNLQKLPDSDDNQVCEATRCSNQATIELNIPLGELGYLHIFVCDICVKKFGTLSTKAANKETKGND